jgi:hypothetical protein
MLFLFRNQDEAFIPYHDELMLPCREIFGIVACLVESCCTVV